MTETRIRITKAQVEEETRKREAELQKDCQNLFDVALAISRGRGVGLRSLIGAARFLSTGDRNGLPYAGYAEAWKSEVDTREWHERYQQLVNDWVADGANSDERDSRLTDLRNPSRPVMQALINLAEVNVGV